MTALRLLVRAAFGGLSLCSPGAAAELDLSGSLRGRYETLVGQPRPSVRAGDDLFSLRTALRAEYKTDEWQLGAELFDSRAYGGKPRSSIGTSEVNAIELVQAYIVREIADIFDQGTAASVQAGRFTLNLGARRLVASDDYRNTTNGYTGLRGDLKLKHEVAATFIYTLPQQRRPDDLPSILDNEVKADRESFDQRLWGGIVAKRRAVGEATLEASYFGFAERDGRGRPTRNRHLHTYGGRLIREPGSGSVDYEFEAFRQTGRTRAGLAAGAALLDVSAWFAHAELGYSPRHAWKPRLAFEADHASGDEPGGKFGRFDTLFGMRRADLAPSGLYAALGRTNLTAIGPRFEAAPSKRLDAFVTYKALWAAARADSFSTTGVRDPAGSAGRFAGHQIDARVRWWWVPERLRAEANGIWLAKGKLLEKAANAPQTGDTRYLSLALTASF